MRLPKTDGLDDPGQLNIAASRPTPSMVGVDGKRGREKTKNDDDSGDQAAFYGSLPVDFAMFQLHKK